MSVAWILTRVATGEAKTLEEWGIKSALRELINQERDLLTLTFGGHDLLGNSPFDLREKLRFDRVVEVEEDVFEAITVFRGLIISEMRGAYGSSEGLTVTLAGPWWYLQNIVYTQPANFATDVSAPTVEEGATGYPLEAKETSQILFAEDAGRSRVDSRFMVIEALNFAIAKGSPIQVGTIDPGISIPRESMSDVTCAEIILRSLRWTPGQSAWFDYTLDPPAIHIRERASRALLELDVADEEISQVELNPRFDLVIPGVTINYLRRHQRYVLAPVDPEVPEGEFTLEPLEVATLDKDQAGPDPTGIGALVLSAELYGSSVFQTAAGAPPEFEIVAQEDAPEGIAARLYSDYSTLQFEGRISLVREECDDTPWIGRAIQMLNGNPAWRDQLMTVQKSVDDILFGRSELTIGPSLQLGPGELLDLLRVGQTIPPDRGDVIIRDFPSPVPVTPPVPPGVGFPPGSEPPTPPTDPYEDVDPSLYILTNVRRSGSSTDNGPQVPWPPGGVFTPPTPQLGPDAPITVTSSPATGIGAEYEKVARRNAGPGSTYYTENKTAEREFTETEFDFGLFQTGGDPVLEFTQTTGIWLIGTQTRSKADRTNETTEFKVNLSSGIGGRTTYRATAPIGETANYDDVISFAVASASGSVALTALRIHRRPPPP